MKFQDRSLLIPALTAVMLAAPILASAKDANCKFSEPRSLKLDLAGAKSVLFEIGSSDLKLEATAGNDHTLSGKACASSQERLQGITLTQRRVGDKLVVSLTENSSIHFSLGSSYSSLDLTGSVPNNILVQLDVGSGDASLSGAKTASADVGSGDVDLRDIAGLVTATVGSGDLKLNGAGTLNLLSIGSGDAVATRIGGKADIGSISSGDLKLKQVGGGVELKSVSSGEAELNDVTGDVVVGSISSGDLRINGVRGNLTVHSLGSGDIDQRGVTGTVNIPKQD